MWQGWHDENRERMRLERELKNLTNLFRRVVSERDSLKQERDDLEEENKRLRNSWNIQVHEFWIHIVQHQDKPFFCFFYIIENVRITDHTIMLVYQKTTNCYKHVLASAWSSGKTFSSRNHQLIHQWERGFESRQKHKKKASNTRHKNCVEV